MKKPLVTFSDFQKFDFKIGKVKEAAFVEGSRNLIALRVDLGQDYGVVEIIAGVGKYYKAPDLIGKKFIFVANLEPKKMLDKISNGMMLAADENGKPLLLPLKKSLKNGLIVR